MEPNPAPLLQIVSEDPDQLVVNKPAGLVCHPTKKGPLSSLIGRLRLHLGSEAEVHFVNRLDRETGGLVLIAKNRARAVQLRKIWEAHTVKKEYLAIVHGHLSQAEGTIDAPLGKDLHSRVAIKDCVRADGGEAQTDFQVDQRFVRAKRPFTLLRVFPRTGRKHQIRIHLNHLGHPIVGDKIYGGDEELYLAFVEERLTEAQRQTLILPCHALHAVRLSIPWMDRTLQYESTPADWFTRFHESASGTDEPEDHLWKTESHMDSDGTMRTPGA